VETKNSIATENITIGTERLTPILKYRGIS
jgi:hypothetical protein